MTASTSLDEVFSDRLAHRADPPDRSQYGYRAGRARDLDRHGAGAAQRQFRLVPPDRGPDCASQSSRSSTSAGSRCTIVLCAHRADAVRDRVRDRHTRRAVFGPPSHGLEGAARSSRRTAAMSSASVRRGLARIQEPDSPTQRCREHGGQPDRPSLRSLSANLRQPGARPPAMSQDRRIAGAILRQPGGQSTRMSQDRW